MYSSSIYELLWMNLNSKLIRPHQNLLSRSKSFHLVIFQNNLGDHLFHILIQFVCVSTSISTEKSCILRSEIKLSKQQWLCLIQKICLILYQYPLDICLYYPEISINCFFLIICGETRLTSHHEFQERFTDAGLHILWTARSIIWESVIWNHLCL